LDPRFTKKKLKHGGRKVTVVCVGMITASGVGCIVHIKGNLNKELYMEILEDDVLGGFHDLGLNYHHFYFQHDNDPKHTSKLVQQWSTNKNMDVLP